MGIIKKAERKEQKGPECPLIFIPTFEKYRELRFVQRVDDDRIVLYPRDMLSWQDLNAYKEATRTTISILEAELIMGIDAVFEGREDG